MFIGVIVIIIGCVFLLQNLGIISQDSWSIIWPMFLIALGLSMVFKNSCSFYNPKKEDTKKKEF
jgi:cyanate permease